MINEPALVILIPGFASDKSDTTCLPAHQNFILHINQLFPHVKLVILAFQYPFDKKEYEWNGNRVIAFGGKNRGGIARRLLWYRVRKKLEKVKSEYTISGVLSFWAGECAVIGKRFAEANGIKHFCWLMGQDARRENRFIASSRLNGEELIAISDFTSKEISRNHGLIAATVIPLGVTPRPVSSAKKNIDILCAGSLIPLKQYHIAIDIARDVKKEFPAFRMMLAGAGPEKERLTTMVRDYELEQNVLIAGEKDHSELLSLMGESRVFLHTSSYEGLGMVCLEALAAGTPVISFTHPMDVSIPGWYKVDSPGAMSRKLISLLNSPHHQAPVSPFPMTDTAKKIMALFAF